MSDDEPLLTGMGVSVHFKVHGQQRGTQRQGTLRAVEEVDLTIARGETLGLVGESGCGKSTLGRALLGLRPLAAGSVRFDGVDPHHAPRGVRRSLRRRMQLVFQDPYSSLNPRMTAGATIAEPVRAHNLVSRASVPARVSELLDMVGLRADAAKRYPHEFSGGQRQRIAIARALACEPEFIVCDEPISALDVSVQAQVLNLLAELRGRLSLTYLFIAHDLAVVRRVSDRVAVMYLGQIVETGSRDDVYGAPSHPYTRALLSAVPIPDPPRERTREQTILRGDLPSPVDPPAGCTFHTRCPLYEQLRQPEQCRTSRPALRVLNGIHQASCHFAGTSTAVPPEPPGSPTSTASPESPESTTSPVSSSEPVSTE